MANPRVAPICPTKLALLNECAVLTRVYSKDISSLHKVTAKGLGDDAYDRLQKLAEESRIQSENARAAFKKHVAEHGC